MQVQRELGLSCLLNAHDLAAVARLSYWVAVIRNDR
jgi:ABC-type dipeptide/oligopeptide/nickel transport system ATPase subunit